MQSQALLCFRRFVLCLWRRMFYGSEIVEIKDGVGTV